MVIHLSSLYIPTSFLFVILGLGFCKTLFLLWQIILCWILLIHFIRGEKGLIPSVELFLSVLSQQQFWTLPKQFVYFTTVFQLSPEQPHAAFKDQLGSGPTQMLESQFQRRPAPSSWDTSPRRVMSHFQSSELPLGTSSKVLGSNKPQPLPLLHKTLGAFTASWKYNSCFASIPPTPAFLSSTYCLISYINFSVKIIGMISVFPVCIPTDMD